MDRIGLGSERERDREREREEEKEGEGEREGERIERERERETVGRWAIGRKRETEGERECLVKESRHSTGVDKTQAGRRAGWRRGVRVLQDWRERPVHSSPLSPLSSPLSSPLFLSSSQKLNSDPSLRSSSPPSLSLSACLSDSFPRSLSKAAGEQCHVAEVAFHTDGIH